MKKFIVLLICFLICMSCADASSVQTKVSALNRFSTENPSKQIRVKTLKETELGTYLIPEGSILNCSVVEVTEPKRGKRDATFYVQLISYTEGGAVKKVKTEYYGKYSKTVLSKEELKNNFQVKKLVRTSALLVGNHYIKGLSTAVAFTEGVVNNEEGNRLKSGVVEAYEESPLSYISEGSQLNINPGDEFYFVFREAVVEQEDMPNYSYTVN